MFKLGEVLQKIVRTNRLLSHTGKRMYINEAVSNMDEIEI